MQRTILLVFSLAMLGLLGWWAVGLQTATPAGSRPGQPGAAGVTNPTVRQADTSSERRPVADAANQSAPAAGSATDQTLSPYVLVGRVIELDGSGPARPLAGARVVLGHPERSGRRGLMAIAETEAGPDGSFRFERPSNERGSELLLEGRADGRTATDWLQVWPEPGDLLEGLDLALVPAATVEGVVEDSESVAIAAASVTARLDTSWRSRRAGPHPRTAYRPRPGPRWTTDAQGGFRATDLAAAGPWTFQAQAGESRGETRIPALTPGMAPVRIRLEAAQSPSGPRVFGHVVGPDGQGLSGAEIHLLASSQQRATCAADGAFEIQLSRGIDRALLVVDAEHHGFLSEELSDLTSDVGPLLLRAPRELRITGRLLDTEGRAIAHARIRIDGEPEFLGGMVPPPSPLRLLAAKFAVTDEAGRFGFGRLAPGSYRVTWQDNDAPTGGAAATVSAGTEDLQLRAGVVLGPQIVWDVTVRDGLSGLPLEAAEVGVARVLRMPYGTGSEGVRYSTTDADGRARLAIAAPAWIQEYQLDVRHPDHATAKLDATEYGVGVHRATLELLPERSLRVRVVDARGQPVPQPQLAILVDGEAVPIRTGRGGAQSPVSADASGHAFLHGLPARSVVLRVWLEGTPVERTLDLRASVEHEVEVVLPD